MKSCVVLAAIAAALISGGATAATLTGPGRFCGYSPIIDLQAGEQIETLAGGIHAGTFRWTGSFGSLDVAGVGWSSKPKGRMASRRTAKGLIRFHERQLKDKYTVIIWNGRQGAAYFSAPRPLTKQQLAAIERVDLFQEGEEPKGCKLRTIFRWE